MRPLVLVLALIGAAACADSDVSRAVGARCDDSSECDDRCLLAGDGWPGGFCTLSCDDDDDCPADTACADTEGGVCLFTCDDVPDCFFLGTGWTCQARDGRPDGEVRVCVED